MEPRVVDFLARWKILVVDCEGNMAGFTTSEQKDNTEHAFATSIFEIFPWFRMDWLTDPARPRIVRDAAWKSWIVDVSAESMF